MVNKCSDNILTVLAVLFLKLNSRVSCNKKFVLLLYAIHVLPVKANYEVLCAERPSIWRADHILAIC